MVEQETQWERARGRSHKRWCYTGNDESKEIHQPYIGLIYYMRVLLIPTVGPLILYLVISHVLHYVSTTTAHVHSLRSLSSRVPPITVLCYSLSATAYPPSDHVMVRMRDNTMTYGMHVPSHVTGVSSLLT